MGHLGQFYPSEIMNLPDADITFNGVQGKLLQGDQSQLVFMEIEPVGEVPPHKHGAQWGIVLDGKMQLTIDGVTKTYTKGDRYYIPDGVVHSALFTTKVYLIDYFADKDRYLPLHASPA